jgi:imidazole glycerol-phosphate synthase subunit HisH
MKIVIIRYNAGNIHSVDNALQRLGVEPIITSDSEEIASADRVIFPGVGEAGTTMRHLQALGLDRLIPTLQQPVLGICLGMQLMCRHSQEGDTPGLGIFDTDVVKFKAPTDGHQGFKVPHMGWNLLTEAQGPLMEPANRQYMYFVHSYYVPITPWTVAQTDYIVPFSAALQKDNFTAVQFHPEKSAEAGQQILQRFLQTSFTP